MTMFIASERWDIYILLFSFGFQIEMRNPRFILGYDSGNESLQIHPHESQHIHCHYLVPLLLRCQHSWQLSATYLGKVDFFYY